jgi:Tfp pilus assembly protein PilO
MLGGRRAPLIAAAAGVALSALVIVLLVLPKRGQVAEARKDLDAARETTTQLQAELDALLAAQEQAPQANRTIRRVDQFVPPTVDEPGALRLFQNAADSADVELTSLSFGTPTAAETGGFSTIQLSVSVTGTYFSIQEFLYDIETLRRAAKVSQVSLAPAGTGGAGELSMQSTIEIYTQDTSAGPGSVPGPTEGT